MSSSKTPLLSTPVDDPSDNADEVSQQITNGRLLFLHNATLCVLAIAQIALTIAILESYIPCNTVTMAALWAMNLITLITVWSLYNIKTLTPALTAEEGDWLEQKTSLRLVVLLTFESFLSLLSPIHFFGQTVNPLFDFNAGIALCVFIRLYHFLRLLRDLDPIYIERSKIRRALLAMNLTPPRFDWLFSLKRVVHDRGFTFCSFTFLTQLLIFSYVMFTIERNRDAMICNALEEEDCWNDFYLVVWFCASTITTVGYGDMVPSTGIGRTIAIIMCCCGVVLLGFIYSIVSQSLKVTPKALAALEVHKLQTLNSQRAQATEEDEEGSDRRILIDRKIQMVNGHLNDNVERRLERIENMLQSIIDEKQK